MMEGVLVGLQDPDKMHYSSAISLVHDIKPEDTPPLYDFDPSQAQDIIRVASYHRHDQDRACITFSPCDIQATRQLLLSPPTSSSSIGLASLQHLDVLPLEILQETLGYLDISSLLAFRRTSRRARDIVTSLPEWKKVTDQAMEALHAIVRTGAAAHITMKQLSKSLTSETCFQCGKFGAFFNLALFVRCCAICRDYTPELATYTATNIRNFLGISDRKLRASMPVLHSLRGSYYTDCYTILRRYRVVTAYHIREAMKQHPQLAQLQQQLPQQQPQIQSTETNLDQQQLQLQHHSNQQQQQQPNSDQEPTLPEAQQEEEPQGPQQQQQGQEQQQPQPPTEHDLYRSIPHKNHSTSPCMTSIALPYLNPKTKSPERGLSCKGCQAYLERNTPTSIDRFHQLAVVRDATFSEEGFLEHFRRCRDAVDMWRESQEGARELVESAWMRNGGWRMPVRRRSHWNYA